MFLNSGFANRTLVGTTNTITSWAAVSVVCRCYTGTTDARRVALNGGAQVMVFVLSFAVFGAAGRERPFPHVGRDLD